MSDLPRSLTDSLFMATLLTAIGGFKAFYVAWYVRESEPIFRIEPTQRMRYFILTLATLICFAPVAFIV